MKKANKKAKKKKQDKAENKKPPAGDLPMPQVCHDCGEKTANDAHPQSGIILCDECRGVMPAVPMATLADTQEPCDQDTEATIRKKLAALKPCKNCASNSWRIYKTRDRVRYVRCKGCSRPNGSFIV